MNAVWKWARIGVCPMTATGRISGGVVPLNARAYDYFACYRLAHAGFLIDWLLPSELPARLPHLSVLITVGHGAFGDELRLALHQFVEGGGVWIAIGSPCDAGDLLGVEARAHPHGAHARERQQVVQWRLVLGALRFGGDAQHACGRREVRVVPQHRHNLAALLPRPQDGADEALCPQVGDRLGEAERAVVARSAIQVPVQSGGVFAVRARIVIRRGVRRQH